MEAIANKNSFCYDIKYNKSIPDKSSTIKKAKLLFAQDNETLQTARANIPIL